LVKTVVEENQPHGYRLIVRDARYSDRLTAWIVVVDVDRAGVDGMDYAKRLAEIEELVEQKAGKGIQVQPVSYIED
jgi:hypothetical protein